MRSLFMTSSAATLSGLGERRIIEHRIDQVFESAAAAQSTTSVAPT